LRLAEQPQHTAGVLVRLREHGLGSMGEYVGFRVAGHFPRHVGVADGGLAGLRVNDILTKMWLGTRFCQYIGLYLAYSVI